MQDPRETKLARVLIDYAMEAGPGKRLLISASASSSSLVRECYRRALQRGAFVSVHMNAPGLQEILLKEGSRRQLEWLAPESLFLAREYDCHLILRSSENTRELSGCDPEKQKISSGARRPWQKLFYGREAAGKLRWCLTCPPTQALAMDAEMSLTEFEDFYFRACLCHKSDPVAAWRAVAASQQRLVNRLKGVKEIHIVGPDTDLRVGVAGRRFINCCGTINMPDGEVFTSPVEDSAEGRIRYSYPVIHNGREVDDVRLVFRAGRVVEASAAKNEAYLHRMLDSDPGARRLGELAIGTNYGVDRFTKQILFDEKIGGTVHLALGMAYPSAGGKNKSSIHWDMICDLRRSGAIYADGRLLQRNGRFTGARR
jgi:aminopeptidase